MSLLLAAEPGNAGRPVILLNGEPNDRQEPHLHESAPAGAATTTLHCGVLISKPIITPGSATGTDVGARGTRQQLWNGDTDRE
jgi:hypothetical protein